MTLEFKRGVIAFLSAAFLVSLLFVQWREVSRRAEESGHVKPHINVPAASKACVDCHLQSTPGLVAHWTGSKHAERGVGCLECHEAQKGEVDGFDHYGPHIATVVTPSDCARCHTEVAAEFGRSHHAKGGNILASLDNFLAEVVEGNRGPIALNSPTPGRAFVHANGMSSANTGCQQCHGAKVGLESSDGGILTVDDFKPGPDGKPTNLDAVARIVKDQNGRPKFASSTWPNTGIGRINLDGSLGSCSACHSRHDFSPRRARQPENCGKCHLGPDHPQKEIYEESKHGVAFRDLLHEMNLDADEWVLGKDYTGAPTCASCHMSGNVRNGGRITHDPGERISWTNRPPVSLAMDTDLDHKIVGETDPEKRRALVNDTWEAKRTRMQEVCSVCHSAEYVNGFYKQYDDFVVLYNEKFAKPGQRMMKALVDNGLRTKADFDEQVEWTWYYLWHHEGRRARHGASMMAPDYAHWHGMFEVAERFYMELIPQVRELAEHGREQGKIAEADAVLSVVNEILARPEHQWYERDLAKMRAERGKEPK
ncbi:MAG: hydroxylamine oxidoreductase [Planctomycetaceae bacterium]|nr:hydroxylamine oxidoreductase [Planctomycetaceae bacterium]